MFSLAVVALSALVGSSSAEHDEAEDASSAAAAPVTNAATPSPVVNAGTGSADERPTLLVPIAHTAGVIIAMRASLWVLWPDQFDPARGRENARNFRLAWTRLPEYESRRLFFESDGDPWLLNVVGHGLFGSEIYLRMRGCGHGPMPSLAAAAIASTAWEYGVEAFHQRPSAIDLVWTPLGGALLGEARHQLYRLMARLRSAGGVLRRAGMILLDPFGEAESALFGVCPATPRARP